MKSISQFEKISMEQLAKDIDLFHPVRWAELPNSYDIEQTYADIRLPERATKGSAGYDIYCPVDTGIAAGETVLIPTGVRCRIDEGWVLVIAPRSGMGTKYGLRLNNTVGIIDSDYYNAKNEGHILLSITAAKPLVISAGERVAQGIFLPYGITKDDAVMKERVGGFGSTGVK